MRPANPEPTIAMLQVRLVDRLRSAGGEMQRNDLRQAIRFNMPAAQFDRIVSPLIARGEITSEMIRRKYTRYDGRSCGERYCTVYRLPELKRI